MVGIAGLGVAAAEAVEDLPQPPISVARGVRVTPADGWELLGRSDDESSVILTRGSGNLGVSVLDTGQAPEQVLRAVIETWTSEPGTSITVGPVQPASSRPPGEAVRAAYSGMFAGITYPVEGELTVATGSGLAVAFDGWSGIGEYQYARPQVEEMIQGTTIP
jgi:hypothetical protein